MPGTSAVYLRMRQARAAKLVEAQVDDVSVSARDADAEAVVRLDEDGTRVAAIVGEESPASASSGTGSNT